VPARKGACEFTAARSKGKHEKGSETMKITKQRLTNIIKEEVGFFVREKRIMKEASGYVMDIFEQMKAKYGPEGLLDQLVGYFNDSELLDCFRFISKQAGQPEPQAQAPVVAPEEPEVPEGEEEQKLEESE
jgi:hypothetical protein